MDNIEQSPHIRAWYRSHATQERERQWIVGVMREFERRTPHRNGNSSRYATTPSSSYPAPSAATTGGGPATQAPAATLAPAPAAAARAHRRPRASVSPKLSCREPGPLSESWVRRHREGGDHNSSPRLETAGLAADNGGLFWRGGGGGGKDRDTAVNTTCATATVLDSSQSSSTSTAKSTSHGRGVRWSSSSCGVHSPVDLRSAGREVGGAPLGLSSPPSGMLLNHEGREDYSPPRPRAFWREEWHAGAGGGGEGEGSSIHQCLRRDPPSLVASDNASTVADEGALKHRPAVAHSRRCCCRSSSPSRDECAVGAIECCRDNSGKGLRPRRCCSRSSLFRDGRAVAEKDSCREKSGDADADARADLVASAKERWGLSGIEAEQTLRKDEEEREECAGIYGSGNNSNIISGGEINGSGGETRSSGNGGVSAFGFALLTAVTVAAFAAGTLVGPPHRHRPPPPSASPSEYTPPGYEPTMQEMMHATRGGGGARRAATFNKVEQTQPSARGGKDGYHAKPTAGAGGERLGGAENYEATSATTPTRVAQNAVTSSSGNEAAATPGNRPVESEPERYSGRDPTNRLASGGEHGEGAVIVEAVMPEVNGGPGSRNAGSPGVKPSMPLRPLSRSSSSSSSSSSPPSSSGSAGAGFAGDGKLSERRRHRRRYERSTMPKGNRPLVVGATPIAFAQTLGSAETSLAGFPNTGNNEQAERAAARRAAMSKSAARSACKLLAWSKADFAVGGDRDDDDDVDDLGCDTDAAWKYVQGGNVAREPFFTLSTAAKRGSPGGGNGGTAGKAMVDNVEAVGRAVVPRASTQGEHAAHGNNVLDVEEAGHEAQLLVAGDVGLGESSSRATTTTTKTTTFQRERGGGEVEVPHNSHKSAKNGQGHSSQAPVPVPRCRGLVLSGNDIRASWVGRYVPVKAPDDEGGAGEVPETGANSVPRMSTPYYCLETPSTFVAAAEAGVHVSREGKGEQREEPPPPAPVPLGFRDEGERPERDDAGLADRPKDAVAVAGGESTTTTAIKSEAERSLPKTPATTSTTTAGAGAAAAAPAATVGNPLLVLPAASTVVTAEVIPENEPGLSEVTDGGLLCLYWADVGDGRWVLDDDLRVSNGVVGVTKGPAPAAADLAFPNQQLRCSRSGAAGVDSEANVGCQYGSGVEGGAQDGVASETEGAAGRASRSWTEEGHPTWLLDSSEMQGWVEANDVFVVCETD